MSSPSPTTQILTPGSNPKDTKQTSSDWNWPMILGITFGIVVLLTIIIIIVWYNVRATSLNKKMASFRLKGSELSDFTRYFVD